jgi:hypothetical protein
MTEIHVIFDLISPFQQNTHTIISDSENWQPFCNNGVPADGLFYVLNI